MAFYKAIRRGFCGEKSREIGEVFRFEGQPGSWMVKVEDQKQAAAEEKRPSKKSKPPPSDDVI